MTADLESLNDAGYIVFSDSEPARDDDSEPAHLEKKRIEGPPYPREAGERRQRNGDEPDGDFPFEPVGTMVAAALGIEPDGSPCLICGTPVRPGYRCPNCNANPRTAGSSTRQVGRRPKTSTYERAAGYVRSEGWQYDLDAFRTDLDRWNLADHERRDLERLREDLIAEVEGF
jgi:hypothetical protein